MTTNWRGVTLDDRSAAMMNAVVALIPSIRIVPIQGSYSNSVSASAGTHSGGGAIDIGCRGLTVSQMRSIETAMRQVGWAAWLRFPNSLWTYHVHGIAIGCPDLASLARIQVGNYYDGLSGLAGGGPDTGNRSYVGVTWETYKGGGGKTEPPPPGNHGGTPWISGGGTVLTSVPNMTGAAGETSSVFTPATSIREAA